MVVVVVVVTEALIRAVVVVVMFMRASMHLQNISTRFNFCSITVETCRTHVVHMSYTEAIFVCNNNVITGLALLRQFLS